jgi:hypothetical protein
MAARRSPEQGKQNDTQELVGVDAGWFWPIDAV